VGPGTGEVADRAAAAGAVEQWLSRQEVVSGREGDAVHGQIDDSARRVERVEQQPVTRSGAERGQVDDRAGEGRQLDRRRVDELDLVLRAVAERQDGGAA